MSASPGASPPVLVVAGSDSSAGAGVDADRDALEAAGVAGRYVVTAWTRQDSTGVQELGAVPPEEWAAQATRIAAGELGAVKFGLLPGESAVRAARQICEALAPGLPVVLDPVLASSSGTRFHTLHGVQTLLAELLPLGLIWTPNLPELAELTGVSLADLQSAQAQRARAGQILLAGGARAVVIKGGHGQEDPVCDLLVHGTPPPESFERPRLHGASIRGSGCRFASYLAAQLARGVDLALATQRAGQFVADRLKNSPGEPREEG